MRPAGRKSVTIPLNGAEYLELDAKSSEAGLSLPAYVRTCCGLSPWIARGREMESGPRPAARRPSHALERLSVTVVMTVDEFGEFQRRSCEAGTTVPQFIRTQCGFEIRNTSLPNTSERDREEDDAWNRLRRLGLEPQGFFPPG
ncbi:MAG: hypothetical protein ACE15B_11860 [Bryobacteraceae bacterium]